MAWYDVFDEETDDWYDSDDDGWGITYDTSFEDPWYDAYGDTLDAAYDAGDESWYNDLGSVYEGPMENRWDTGWGGQANKWTGIGSTLGDLGNTLSRYTGSGSLLGGLLGGTDGSLSGSDLAGYGRNLFDAYMGKRDNDRYNEMMQPLTNLYRDQAADVRQRRANRDANLAGEYSEWEGMMQPQWDRRDQRAENLRQKQGVFQSSSAAWDRAANEQARDATKLASRRKMAQDYDAQTAALGGVLPSYAQHLTSDRFLERQENPWLGMLSSSITG